jgi:hypothetical protein
MEATNLGAFPANGWRTRAQASARSLGDRSDARTDATEYGSLYSPRLNVTLIPEGEVARAAIVA